MNNAAINIIVSEAEECLGPYCTCRGLKIYGFSHLRRAAAIAGRIAAATGQNVESAVVAGFLHDCARRHESGDAGHAHDSADLARVLLPMFYPHLNAHW